MLLSKTTASDDLPFCPEDTRSVKAGNFIHQKRLKGSGAASLTFTKN